MDLRIRGKRAIILAGSRGLGRATAEALAAEGCDVAICARNGPLAAETAREITKKHGVRAMSLECDVASEASLNTFLQEAVGRLGGVDILVTNCGGPSAGGAEDIDDETWQAAWDLVFFSVVRSCRYVVPMMKKQGWGRILAITSSSVRQPIPGLVLSNALRPAVAGYLKTLALELAPYGVLVHYLMPGGFLTERARDLAKATSFEQGIPLEAVLESKGVKLPAGRLGDPEEFGATAAFFASDRCQFTTGTGILIDGGQIRHFP